MKINRCPKCGREPSMVTLSIAGDTIGYETECYDCGLHTGRCETRDEAIKEWNKMIEGLRINIHKCENCGCEKPKIMKDFQGRWAIKCYCGTNSVYGLENNKMGTIRWWNDLMSKLED